MAFHLLYGENPGLLLDRALERICEEAVRWPTKRGYIIVPEKMKAEVERRYIEILQEKKAGGDPRAAFMMIDVVSFSRFAYRVVSEVGGTSGRSMDPVAKTILIHRILRENEESFPQLSRFAERVGSVREIDEVLGDFYRYNITAPMLKEMDCEGIDPTVAQKISDFGLLIEKLDQQREAYGFAPERYSMKRLAEVLELMREDAPETKTWPLRRLSFLRQASAWILGFGENRIFTPEEYNIVTLLASVMEKVTLTAVSDLRGEASENDLCHFGNKTVEYFGKVKPFSSMERIEGKSKQDARLQKIFLDYSTRAGKKEDDAFFQAPVEIRVFPQINDELEYVAARISEMVRLGDYRYRDITIVLCDPSKYESSLHAAFARFGLDAFLDSNSRLMGTSWLQYVQAVLDMCRYNWKLSFVMNWMRSGFVALSPILIDKFENYCLLHGIKDRGRMLKCLSYAKDEHEKTYFEPVSRKIKELDQGIRELTRRNTCSERAVVLHDLIATQQEKVEKLVDEWASAGNQEAALALAASYNALDDALRALAGPVGDFDISCDNFCDAVLSAVSSKVLRKIPSYVDQITVTDPANAYRRPCRTLFVVGPNRNNFPFSSPSEGYLKNREREVIAEKLSMDFPNHAKDRSYSDFFTACALLQVPTERIIFTMGNNVEMSSMIHFIQENYPNISAASMENLSLSDPRVLKSDRMQDYLREALTDRITVGAEEWDKLRRIWKKYFGMRDLSDEQKKDPDLQIPKEQILERFKGQMRMSVSSIESYVMCPYRYFCEKVLTVEERKVQSLAYTDIGTIAHEMVRHAVEEFRAELDKAPTAEEKKEVLAAYTSREKRPWAEKLLSDVHEKSTFAFSEDPAMKKEADGRIVRSVSETLQEVFDRIDPDGFVPARFEMDFGKDGAPPYEITLKDGEKVDFNGTIDRVDIDPVNKRFRIVDYKTGAKKIDYDAIYAGESVQLLAYMYIYQKLFEKEFSPDGVSYLQVRTASEKSPLLGQSFSEENVRKAREESLKKAYRGGTFSMQADSEDMLLAAERSIESIKKNCELLFGGHFPSKPGKIGKKSFVDCSTCAFAAVCNQDQLAPQYTKLPTFPMVKGGADGKKVSFFTALKGSEKSESDNGTK